MKSLKTYIITTFAIMLVSSKTNVLAFANNSPTVPLYPAEDFFSIPEQYGFRLTPDGESLIFSKPIDDIVNVFKRDIKTGEDTQLTFETEDHILYYKMVGDTLVFNRDNADGRGDNLYRIEEDGTITQITFFKDTRPYIFSVENNTNSKKGDVLLSSNHENLTDHNIYRFNIFTLEIELVYESTYDLIFDNDGVLRIVIEVDLENNLYIIKYRATETEDFKIVKEVSRNVNDLFRIISFDETNENIYVRTNLNQNLASLVKVNPSDMEIIETIYETENVDVWWAEIGFLEAGQIDYVLYYEDYREIEFFSEEMRDIYEQINNLLPEKSEIDILTKSDDNNIMIIASFSDVNRGQQYIFNRAENTLQLVADYNGTNPEHMAPMTPIRYTTRDGLELSGYLTLPVGVEPSHLPTIVLPLIGLGTRNFWKFNAEAQFLANRGYAVVKANVRGSDGFGREFVELGNGQFGLASQDDITDAVNFLIEEGIADPSRIGIVGDSFGGYSVLRGITQTPELYAAAVAISPISSMVTFFDNIPPYAESEKVWLFEKIGDPEDVDKLREISPLYTTQDVITPLFIAHGAENDLINLSETLQFVEKLQGSDTTVELMVKWDESDAFVYPQNITEYYRFMEAFLSEYLGGRTSHPIEHLNYTTTLEEVLEIMNE